MRLIKFRAWDDFNKCWPSIGWSIQLDSAGVVKELHPHIKLMQFTGLHDKNGVEIFEGDVVNCREYGCDRDIEKYAVEDMVSFFLFLHQEFNDFSEESSELEVIGNVHESPELLSEQKGR